jgi:exopolysaccharide biosynthesis polyprenyl glycosylphosphotransferase
MRLLHVADAVVLYGAMVAINTARFGTRWPDYPLVFYITGFAIATAIHLVVFALGGLYDREQRLGIRPRLPQTTALTGLAVLLCGVAALGLGRYLMPRANLVILFVVASALVAGNRVVVRWLRIQREGVPRVLLVGAPDEVNLARKHLQDAPGRVAIAGESGDVAELAKTVEVTGATDVLVLSGRMLDDLYPGPLSTLEQRQVGVLQVVSARDSLLGLRNVREIGGMPVVALHSHLMATSEVRLKRLFDVALLVVLLPALGVLTGLVALYVRLTAGTPVLFRQERVGRAGQPFWLVKFRTMYLGAEAITGPVLAERDDPRVVPALRWVRAMRLDELPQLWNVVRGEMSVVGPRPERPELAARWETLIPGYSRRCEIPPGITGLAQVHGRYHTDAEYKLGHDLQYLANWSPVLDVQILFRTVWVILSRRL